MKNVTLFIGSMILGVLVFTACSSDGLTSSEGGGEISNFLSNKQALIDAKESLMNLPKFKGKQVMVFQGFAIRDDGSISLELQDPDNPDNIDSYSFSEGKWEKPVPVQITGGGDMSYNLTPLDDLKFELIPDMMKIHEEKASTVEGAEIRPDNMSFYLFVPSQSRYWSCGFIRGTRDEYKLDFNLDGTVKEFEKR